MSDRTILSLAAVPMISGALLLIAFQRAPALHAAAPAQPRRFSITQGPLEGTRERRWVGVIVAGDTAELAAESDGRVVDVYLEAGARVSKGQAILQIDSSDAAGALGMASAELGQRASEAAKASAKLEEANNKLRRLQAGGKWISEHEIEQAQAAVRMAQAELRAAQSGVQMGRAKVTLHKGQASRYRLSAPFAGTLVACDVDPGDSVAPGQVLAKVISDDRQVRFAFPPDQAPDKDEFPVLVRDSVSGRSMFTTVRSVKPEVDTSAQLVFATAILNLTDGERKTWIPGTRVEVTPADGDVQNNERFQAPAAEPKAAPPASNAPAASKKKRSK